MSQRLSKASEAISKKECVPKKPVVFELPKLKSQYGVDAWKRWIQRRRTQPDLEKPRYACKSGHTVNTVTPQIFIYNFTIFTNTTADSMILLFILESAYFSNDFRILVNFCDVVKSK